MNFLLCDCECESLGKFPYRSSEAIALDIAVKQCRADAIFRAVINRMLMKCPKYLVRQAVNGGAKLGHGAAQNCKPRANFADDGDHVVIQQGRITTSVT